MKEARDDIKIFVSRRIDVDSVAVPNPLFIPVRCGAVFDQQTDSPYLGDDTGDNISQKRMSFCEFTVQYWAWKNTTADYVGLCHYRRYLSFSTRTYRLGKHGLVENPLLDEKSMQRFGLLDETRMRRLITQYDLLCAGIPVAHLPTPHGYARTVQEHWEAFTGLFFDDGIIDHLLELIDVIVPEYSDLAREYLESNVHIGYNCFVMRWELFDRLCNFQFPIMGALANTLEGTDSIKKFSRTIAYAGEILFGIFLYYIIKTEHPHCDFHQLVMFDETRPVHGLLRRTECFLRYGIDQIVWWSSLRLFPMGSQKRERVKRIYLRLTGRAERKENNGKTV